MKIERMYARGAEYQRFETLKRNREKRTRQKLAFMEGVQMVEQAIRHNWEFAAMAVADAVCRLVPGVLADPECFQDESHWDGLLEYPQYTRPADYKGMKVPQVLLDGNHALINKWRREQQLLITKKMRPDLLQTAELSKKDVEFLQSLEKEEDNN